MAHIFCRYIIVLAIYYFYYDDEISRIMPEQKECPSEKTSDTDRVKMQKRLMLSNMKKVYMAFKEKYSNFKVGLAKVAEL